MNRRQFLTSAGAAAISAGGEFLFPASSMATSFQAPAKPDFTVHIAPLSVELAPGQFTKTTGYNGSVPGPVLRMREGVKTTVEVVNDTDSEELVHWHGLKVPSDVDGAAEEGTPAIPAHGRRRYSFVPGPAGTRWYHTHSAAGSDLARGMYSGQFGFLYVAPKSEPGNYDSEVFLALHQWEPFTTHMGPQNNGFEIGYQYSSFNSRMLGHGEPIRVRNGDRVLFRILNASATDDLKIHLPGHQFLVVALDGNPVLTTRAINILQLGVAERVDAIVEMQQPGVWTFGAVSDKERGQGMGVVVEYANQKGDPQWTAPPREGWDYGAFGRTQIPPDVEARFDLVFRKIPGERVRFNRWTINGKSFPDTDPLVVQQGKRYRLSFRNESGDTHPLHLHRHSFEITAYNGRLTGGVFKDVVLVNPFTTAEVDFIADNPGPTLFHCHAQHHMDFGFMNLVKYA